MSVFFFQSKLQFFFFFMFLDPIVYSFVTFHFADMHRSVVIIGCKVPLEAHMSLVS